MEELQSASQEQIIRALVYGLIFLVLMATGLILFFYYSRKKILQKEQEKLNLQIRHQKKILQASIQTQEKERQRIAQDLHDAISAKLNVISLSTHVLLDDPSTNAEQRTTLSHILDVTSNTLESSRKIAHDLMPPILEKFGLKVALEELFDDFTKSKQIDINYDIDDFESGNKTSNLHIFRIIQELINNSIRHGNATQLDIIIKRGSDFLTIEYKDNGIGFDTEAVSKKSGIGLQNINSRVAILNGSMVIESKINKGSVFTINCRTNE